MITVEEAIHLISENMVPQTEVQVTDLLSACGRILAEDAAAGQDQPPFDRSPLDGYAVRSADVRGAAPDSPVRLQIVDEIFAGQVSQKTVGPGECVRIMTGAPMPAGTDTVIRQEDTDYPDRCGSGCCESETGGTVRIVASGGRFQNYCFAGEDYKAGEVLLKRGTRLGAVQIGILAGLGRKTVNVFRKPRVLLLTTGDECIEPGDVLTPGKIYNSNRYLLEAGLREYGAEIAAHLPVRDDAQACAETIRKYAGRADLVVSTGGVSVGKKDILHEVMREPEAEQVFWKVQMKPGSPLLFGLWKREETHPLPVICLSGNPYAAFAEMVLILKPAVTMLCGGMPEKPLTIKTVLRTDFKKPSPSRRFVRGYYDGKSVSVTERGGNGTLSALNDSNCLIEIPAGSGPLAAGEAVSVRLL